MDGMKAKLEKCGCKVNYEDERKNSTYKKDIKHNRNTGKEEGKSKDTFWEKYLAEENKYFFDQEKKKMNPDYVDLYAQILARKFHNGGIKITQIRGFFNTVVKLNRIMNGNLIVEKEFDEISSDIRKLKFYANRKKTDGYVTQDFVSFVEKNVDSVHDKKDLKAFKSHFEAIIGYMPKDN